jgi:acetyltransferase-like isoleucine patch superfamily enzyme
MRKILRRMSELAARRRIGALPGVKVARDAKVAYSRIRLCDGSRLEIGSGSIVECQLVAERSGAHITIGERSFIGDSLVSCATRIHIGDDVLVSWGCNIVDHNSHPIVWNRRKRDVNDWYRGQKEWGDVHTGSVTLGDKSWLGFNVGILKGVHVGQGAIIGAGSIVTKDVPAWTIVAGNPAKLVRELTDDER